MIRAIFHRLPASLNLVWWAQRYYRFCARGVIQAGPFARMPYLDQAYCSALVPKLAGSYEKELAPWLEHVERLQPDVFVDVGAAEGYYAVGIAAKGWSKRVIAFESDASARAACSSLAQKVGLPEGRLEIRAEGSIDGIATALAAGHRRLLLMDAEGAESYLLDPLRAPVLARTEILVEYHEFLVGGVRDILIERFHSTHHIEELIPQPRRSSDFVSNSSILRNCPSLIRRLMLAENRPFARHGWLWLRPKSESWKS